MSNQKLDVLIQSILRKETAYGKGIEDNHTSVLLSAKRLEHLGDVEKILGEEATNRHREDLMKTAEDNVLNERQLQAYMNAVRTIGKKKDGGSIEDFQMALEETLQEERDKIDAKSVPMTQEKKYKEVANNLGVQPDDDDELAVLPPSGGGGEKLKCPLSMKLMNDPVKSTVCGHVYSNEAISAHIRFIENKNRGKRPQNKDPCQCPVPGCSNRDLTFDQLVKDDYTSKLVIREKKRLQRAQQSQSQSAIEVDDDDF
jgi:hypothetical protein